MTDSWEDSITLFDAEYNNEDINVFAVCKYIIYIPPIMNGDGNIDVCEIEIGGKLKFRKTCVYLAYSSREGGTLNV